MNGKRLTVGFAGVGLSAVVLAAGQPRGAVHAGQSDGATLSRSASQTEAPWEYQSIARDGRDGWELVAVQPNEYVFRRSR
jgi:hypothetical protein